MAFSITGNPSEDRSIGALDGTSTHSRIRDRARLVDNASFTDTARVGVVWQTTGAQRWLCVLL